ncbi:hypothetical protein PHLGIDRAFT_333566 [Phlebiopsis gigantea 11061_1 CR5-6]|uniref:Uncharacterized protein n=1 Tax=Phlebiopsis gigantea (strain 11061_1 CR5-6) TaxID=745531 RepID=A0A0C3SD37_PHLG1|nr:hypothetical protein PHLGIDRAFT_333566 [Phlebiopsis gigantea 11061_1 CR5-6]
MTVILTSLPEEILERILAYTLASTSSSSDSQPALLKSSFTRSQSTPFPVSDRSRSAGFKQFSRTSVHRYTPLLACTVFARIGTALIFSDLHVKTAEQCSNLKRILRQRPDLARCVKAVRLDGAWGDSKDLVKALSVSGGRLENFDFCITPQAEEESALPAFCKALAALPTVGTVKHLRVRKASDAYLTLSTPNRILEVLAQTIPRWGSLETVNIGFRLPSGPRKTTPSTALPSNATISGVSQFVLALAQAPSLKAVHAELPAVWNTALLDISSNPSLHSITLSPAPVTGGHMFLTEARKHPRLAELIENGTPAPTLTDRIGRTMLRISVPSHGRTESHGRMRANTTVAASPSPRSVAFPKSSASPPCLAPSAAPSAFLSPSGPSSSSRPRRVSSRASKGSRRMSTV